MDRSYRIKANIGKEQVLNVNLKQDIDLYEILSLKIGQDKMYKTHSANYGVIVGRVLANDAFGVPNARVSIFIPLSDEDSLRSDISAEYPYKSVTDYNDNIRYNTLPIEKKFECHANVGTFPNKELVLDDDLVLEVFDNYYKYTTVTNNSGDYMIFGVPTGGQIIHVDVDLSDIGVLSQSPRDFIYKGYSPDMFESPNQFKKGDDLDSLPQIFSENTSVNVYPFWGDKTHDQIAITRKDINLHYKFEPTCIFLGSVITDNGTNSIGHSCIPDEHVGDADQLEAIDGTIEMIRKRPDDVIESFSIKGNKLIDGDGVFCYQIPMNLDFVGMDEYGNICPTDNPDKGIPTRARVRFRFSVSDNGDDSLTNHTAKFLVPNNPDIVEESISPRIRKEVYDGRNYEFGSLTPDECFRDLYWNKIYSIKTYIPRIQASKFEKTANYFGIKGVNKKGARDINPIPFNKINLNFSIPTWDLLDRYYQGESRLLKYWRLIRSLAIPYNFDSIVENILDETDGVGLDFYNDWLNGCLYFPAWNWRVRLKKKYKKGENAYDSSFCECTEDSGSTNSVEKLYLFTNCSLIYNDNELNLYYRGPRSESEDKSRIYNYYYANYHSMPLGSRTITGGIIKKIINKDGGEIYYYSFGNIIDRVNVSESEDKDNDIQYDYARLFSTDIILLGSFNDCDIDGVPKMPFTYPSTTATIPPIGMNKNDIANGNAAYSDNDAGKLEKDVYSENGMHWGRIWKPVDKVIYVNTPGHENPTNTYGIHKKGEDVSLSEIKNTVYNNSIFSSGLFFGVRRHKSYHGWGPFRHVKNDEMVAQSNYKTCVNVERLSELGVSNDAKVSYSGNSNILARDVDGLITKKELDTLELRSLFASLNSNPLIGTKENETTGYKTYNLVFTYPSNFDGRLEGLSIAYTTWLGRYPENDSKHEITRDMRSKDYLDFRFGSTSSYSYTTSRNGFGSGRRGIGTSNVTSTSNSNGAFGGKRGTGTVEDNDGDVIISYSNISRTRHFYGTSDEDERKFFFQLFFPLRLDDWNDNVIQNGKTKLPFVFPLYYNSFYFYFGLNRGNTAIDKFYRNFYSDCKPSVDTVPFVMNISVVNNNVGSICLNKPSGMIKTTIEDIAMPYTIQLIDSEGNEIENSGQLNVYEHNFFNLENGTYIVRITDVNGSVREQEVVLEVPTVTLSWEVVFPVRTEYYGQFCTDICNNDYYALLEMKSYTIDNTLYKITAIVPSSTDGLYELQSANSSSQNIPYKVMLEIKPKDGSSFSSVTCQCSPVGEIDGTKFIIYKPVLLDAKVKVVCNGDSGTFDSNIYSMYDIAITDTKQIEMLINNVPLKYITGPNKDLLSGYVDWFYDGEATTSVNNKHIKGWFGLHVPDTYSELFRLPTAGNNLSIWAGDTDGTLLDIVYTKFRQMFELSRAAYVTAGSDNTFKVSLTGGLDLLLRSAGPVYTDFDEDNKEQQGSGITSFMTSELDTMTVVDASPNIVSKNYRLLDVNNGLVPQSQVVVNPYDFNPKYNDKVNSAGNYFAGFSNNALIYQISDTGCTKSEGDFKKVPLKTHELYNDNIKMCLTDERPSLIGKVYKKETTLPYLRTEFIDRRFDFDAFYVTPCANGSGVWANGKLSALTYNGIEMAYDSRRNIIGADGSYEYTYGVTNGSLNGNIIFNKNNHKRFYESYLEYLNGQRIDLRDFYRSSIYTPTSSNGIMVINSDSVNGNEFKNFYLDSSTPDGVICGYPTNRWLNIYNIPYGDYYTFSNTSCYYDPDNIQKRSSSIVSLAAPGENVNYTIETGNLVKLVQNDFDNDIAQNDYNVSYDGDNDTWFIVYGKPEPESTDVVTMTANKLKRLKFKIDSQGTEKFISKIEGLGIYVCKDDCGHSMMYNIKTGTTISEIENQITGNSIVQVFDGSAVDTTINFRNKEFNASGDIVNDKFIHIIFDRYYYSTYKDCLMKKLRVLNASTMYDVSDFEFAYLGHQYVEKDFNVVISADTIVVTGTSSIDVVIPPSEEGGDPTTEHAEGESEGSGKQDASGVTKDVYDCLYFKIKDKPCQPFGECIFNEDTGEYVCESGCNGCYISVFDIEDYCFKVYIGDEIQPYKRAGGAISETIEVKDVEYDICTVNCTEGPFIQGEGEIRVKLPLKNHMALLKQTKKIDGVEIYPEAKIYVSLKMKNGLVYHFGFKIEREPYFDTNNNEQLKVTIKKLNA